jgi:hypothetical protein
VLRTKEVAITSALTNQEHSNASVNQDICWEEMGEHAQISMNAEQTMVIVNTIVSTYQVPTNALVEVDMNLPLTKSLVLT